MKIHLLSLLAAFALTVGTAAAQTTTQTAPASSGATAGRGYGRAQGNPEEMATRQSQRLSQQLSLNADQTAKVQQILLARGQEMQALRGQARDAGSRDQLRPQMEANRAKYDEQFKAVLTPDQYTKYTTMQADRMHHGRRGHDGDSAKVKTKNNKIKIKKAGK
jgi:Spy/CpxP family protein refolding chaperone